MQYNNWWNNLSEEQKQNIWFNEAVSKWWNGLDIGEKISYSNSKIGSGVYGKLTQKQKIEIYENLTNVPKMCMV